MNLNLDRIFQRLNRKPDVQQEAQGEPAESGLLSLLKLLDEVRTRLVRSALALAIFFVLSWIFADQLFAFIQKPVVEALDRAGKQPLATVVDSANVGSLQENDPVQYTFRTETTLGDIPVPAGVSIPGVVKKENGKPTVVMTEKWIVGNAVIPAGTPLPVQMDANSPNERLIIDTVTGAFSLYIRVAFYAAIFFAMPFLLYQLWGFISPRLYRHQQRYVWPFISMGTVFFLLGAAFGYKIAFPRAADWLLGLASDFRPLIRANEYFDLIIIIMLGLGAVFQIPTITFFLARIGMVTPKMMIRPWRYAIVLIFIVAAVISPTGDIPNLLIFALPMLVLYALSIGIAWVFNKQREAEAV